MSHELTIEDEKKILLNSIKKEVSRKSGSNIKSIMDATARVRSIDLMMAEDAEKQSRAKIKTRKLTNPEQNFVLAVIAGEKDVEAYKIAYKTKRMNSATIRKEAHTVRARLHVIEAIRKEHEKMAKDAAVTVDSLVKELEEARDIAKSERSGGSMVAATMGKAKLYGLDKVVIEVKNAEELTPWSAIKAGVDDHE